MAIVVIIVILVVILPVSVTNALTFNTVRPRHL